MFKYPEDMQWAQGLGQPRPEKGSYHYGSIHEFKGKHLRIEDKDCPHEFDLELLEKQKVDMESKGFGWSHRVPRHSLTGNTAELTINTEGYDRAPKSWSTEWFDGGAPLWL